MRKVCVSGIAVGGGERKFLTHACFGRRRTDKEREGGKEGGGSLLLFLLLPHSAPASQLFSQATEVGGDPLQDAKLLHFSSLCRYFYRVASSTAVRARTQTFWSEGKGKQKLRDGGGGASTQLRKQSQIEPAVARRGFLLFCVCAFFSSFQGPLSFSFWPFSIPHFLHPPPPSFASSAKKNSGPFRPNPAREGEEEEVPSHFEEVGRSSAGGGGKRRRDFSLLFLCRPVLSGGRLRLWQEGGKKERVSLTLSHALAFQLSLLFFPFRRIAQTEKK